MTKTYKDEPWGVQARNPKVQSIKKHECGHSRIGYIHCSINEDDGEDPWGEVTPQREKHSIPTCGDIPLFIIKWEDNFNRKTAKQNNKPERRKSKQELHNTAKSYNTYGEEGTADWDMNYEELKGRTWFWSW